MPGMDEALLRKHTEDLQYYVVTSIASQVACLPRLLCLWGSSISSCS
jgi:hypothetical protein